MSRSQLFPAALILFDVAAAVAYGLEADARRAIYWPAAGRAHGRGDLGGGAVIVEY